MGEEKTHWATKKVQRGSQFLYLPRSTEQPKQTLLAVWPKVHHHLRTTTFHHCEDF